MSERRPQPSLHTQIQPQTEIMFGGVTDLSEFEDAIAPLVDPGYDAELWATRAPLRELIRPPDVNKIQNIVLVSMDNPYGRLVQAGQEGRLPGIPMASRDKWNSGSVLGANIPPEQFAGFDIEADTYRSLTKTGQVTVSVWYFPASKQRRNQFGEGLRRIVTVPVTNQGEVAITMSERRRRIGYMALREQLRQAQSRQKRT